MSDKFLTTRGYTDIFTGALAQMDNDHVYIHRGQGFAVTGDVILADGASWDISITTPTGPPYVHYRPEIVSTVDDVTKVTLFEGSVISGGSEANVYNRNRVNASSPESVLKEGVSSDTEGTILYSFTIGSGGNNASKSGGQSGGAQEEWIFKADTTYVIRIENIGSTQTTAYYNFFWYEEGAG